MKYLVTRWFKITQYNNKIAMSIKKLVENTCMSRYHRSIEIMYDQGS